MNAHHVKIFVKMPDALKVKQRIDKGIAELDNQGILSVSVDNRMHFHRPDQQEIPLHQMIGILVDHKIIRLSGTDQNNLTIRVPVSLVTPFLISGGQIESAETFKPIVFVLAEINDSHRLQAMFLFAL